MSKAYNIIEASNMINTEFKVVYKSGEDRVRNVYVNADGTILNMVNDSEMTVVKGYGDLINAKFYKVQPPVTFEEALESKSQCIKAVYEPLEIDTEYTTMHEILYLLSYSFRSKISEILLNAKWYIKED